MLNRIGDAKLASCPPGWFGSNCQFKCHCAPSNLCNGDDGSCISRCHPGWFGPACQYASMPFAARSGSRSLEWLTDKDDVTCNTNRGNNQTLIILLVTPIPLGRVRAVVSDSAYLNNSEISHERGHKSLILNPTKKNATAAFEK
ncbi:hypothetical protein RRG08_064678 [Elysia crispata]|uniref:EGF-like domain-containing protein n=1 Tax=Elysia crispata TaxID=231223 RepID=A0AAE0XV56_9GAST|nr:hypothetical protein RRG08_064678 [Elysia crispata]